jgi:hypothetical protein
MHMHMQRIAGVLQVDRVRGCAQGRGGGGGAEAGGNAQDCGADGPAHFITRA